MSSFKVILGLAAILVAFYIYFPPKDQEKAKSDKSPGENKTDPNARLDGLEEDDYYGILELKDDASPEEIRLSFRRLSRMHHPDKNLDDQEGATRRCAKVNRAYETLSDQASRAEYDYAKKLKKSEPRTGTARSPQNPRSRSSEETSSQMHSHDDGCPGCVFRARWGISSTQLQLFSLPGLHTGMDDSPTGFFAMYRFVFESLIAEDECKFAGRDPSSFPSFGYSNWSYNAPFVKFPKRNKKKGRGPKLIKKDAKPFYDFWTTFSSKKDFGWAKAVDVSDVPDSALKRFFQKENKMLQNQARNDYNETVRDLVKHVRRMDPRCR